MKNIILILLLQLAYVPLLTLRTLFLVKNMTTVASILGFLESLVYVFGLSLVFSGEQGPLAMLVYALGFGLGILIGGAIENKLAIGYHHFSVNLMDKNPELIQKLRDERFGLTIYEGSGRDSKRYRLELLTRRSRERELLEIINEYEPDAFIVSYEPRMLKGGFIVDNMRKASRKINKP